MTNLFYFELLDVVDTEIKASVIVGVAILAIIVVEVESTVRTKR